MNGQDELGVLYWRDQREQSVCLLYFLTNNTNKNVSFSSECVKASIRGIFFYQVTFGSDLVGKKVQDLQRAQINHVKSMFPILIEVEAGHKSVFTSLSP